MGGECHCVTRAVGQRRGTAPSPPPSSQGGPDFPQRPPEPSAVQRLQCTPGGVGLWHASAPKPWLAQRLVGGGGQMDRFVENMALRPAKHTTNATATPTTTAKIRPATVPRGRTGKRSGPGAGIQAEDVPGPPWPSGPSTPPPPRGGQPPGCPEWPAAGPLLGGCGCQPPPPRETPVPEPQIPDFFPLNSLEMVGSTSQSMTVWACWARLGGPPACWVMRVLSGGDLIGCTTVGSQCSFSPASLPAFACSKR